MKLILFFLLLIFICIPFNPWPFLNGLPLNHVGDISAILFLFFIIFIVPWKEASSKAKFKTILAIVILIFFKFFLNLFTLSHGLLGFYYDNKTFSGNYQRSPEYLRLYATRIDEEIFFQNSSYSIDQKAFYLGFLNGTFKGTLDFSVLWQGYLYVSQAKQVSFSIICDGECSLSIDNQSSPKNEISSQLSEGFHYIEIKYINSSFDHRSINFRWSTDKNYETVDAAYLYPFKPSHIMFKVDEWVRKIAPILFWAQFLLLCFLLKKYLDISKLKFFIAHENFFLFLFFIVFITRAFINLINAAQDPYFCHLSSGDDWRRYEIHSRLIIFGDWLDSTEAPYHFTPFYRYFLAFVHLIFGENLFMAFYMQFLLLYLSSIFIYKMTKKVFNLNIAVLALLLFSFSALPQTVAKQLLAEPLGAFFSCASLAFLIFYFKKNNIKILFASGITMGLAIITRPNLFSFLFFLIPWLIYFRSSVRKSLNFKPVFIYSLGCFLIIGCLTARNYVTSGKVVMLTTSGGMNLWEGNIPPAHINLRGIEKNKIYNLFNFDARTRAVLEYLKQDPLLFLRGLMKKLSYIAGHDPDNWGGLGARFYIDKFLIFVLFFLGFLFCLLDHQYSFKQEFVAVGFFAITVISTLTIIKPLVYGWRLQSPAVPFMMVFVAYFLDRFLISGLSYKRFMFYVQYLILVVIFNYLVAPKFFLSICLIYLPFYFKFMTSRSLLNH
ncbi:MAG: glycosyltransferase family 39 protein [Deltaproteobacteria bacterium]|nr:glycosyltransferase family 39 protein [Deltaproteobacteria bacterium]